eukprot:CAMPEP_0170786734 /NCGR_PEP_ID=MMETSP0733-20121128/17843_1 /TAXON_ID=186038 /ORGANISM="Fragilariopsis kerguelensis, Strain L26-C5" /LENGTH=51 /DNA_ID=CAMNT_0011132765 /DNA_START=34 /DNA_END=185 /DNA_ORIENTATION=-
MRGWDHDSNGNDTTPMQADDKDGYCKQDKDDDVYNKNGTRRKTTTPIQYST